MEQIKDIVSQIEKLTSEFMTDATSNLNGNKAAGRRARKATLALAKLCKEYRTLTLNAEKAE